MRGSGWGVTVLRQHGQEVGKPQLLSCGGLQRFACAYLALLRFGKISAVEGIRLTQAMEKRAADAALKGLTAEEYRRAIVRSYRKG